VTALRWAAHLRALGRRVFLSEDWRDRECAPLIVLHAEKGAPAALRFARAHPDRPLVVACAGTDVYGEGKPAPRTLEALRVATRIVVLQPHAPQALPAELRERSRVIHQSVRVPPGQPAPASGSFDVCVIAHLRAVKDPLLAARASRRLRAGSAVRVVLVGGVLDEALAEEARGEERSNRRFRWLGALDRAATLATLARSRLCVSSSRHEGGSNAVSEALALDVPVLATAIPGNAGLLGEDHPGLFPVGDAGALAGLLERAEGEPSFYEELRARGRARAWTTAPELERRAWQELLDELDPRRNHVPPGGPAARSPGP
jgi:putative glycosyltransferase (TIGR04348 family)